VAVPYNTSIDEMLQRSVEITQFTSAAFLEALRNKQIKISMDGRGAWRDNVFVERFWRTIKYEEVYLHAYDTVSAAKAGIERYMMFYNHVSYCPTFLCC
jgi:putative transposase